MSALQEMLNRLHLRRFERPFKHALASLLGLFLPRERFTQGPPGSIKNILVIRQHNQLGDMLCAVPLLRALRQRFPAAHLSLVASPVNYDVVFHNLFIDEVILYDKFQFLRSPVQFIKFYRKLREQHYELAIVPSTVSMSFTSDAMAYFCGARYRVGAGSLNGAENVASHFFNIPLVLNWEESQGPHHTERNLEFGRCIGADTEDHSVVIQLTEEEKKFGEDFLSKHLHGRKQALGFHPGAGKLQNRWPAEQFTRIAERLARDFNALVVVTAGPMDDEPVQKMIKNLSCPFVLVREKSIRNVAAIIDRLSLYVTNDTGVMHVAGATSTSVLSLFGPSDPYQWAPRSNRHKFILSRDRDIKSITEDEVYTAAIELLKSR